MRAWFYMLRLRSGGLYVGATRDMAKRWRDHKDGFACRTTKHDPPVALVHQEICATYKDACAREAQVKRWSRAKKEALAAGSTELLRALAVSHDHSGE